MCVVYPLLFLCALGFLCGFITQSSRRLEQNVSLFGWLTSYYMLLPSIRRRLYQNGLFTTRNSEIGVFPNLITCEYEYWRENSIIPNRQVNAHLGGSVANGGAARRKLRAEGLSEPLNTFLFLIALTVEMSIANLPSQALAGCGLCLPSRYLKLEKPARARAFVPPERLPTDHSSPFTLHWFPP